jgi:hypothetical protein
MRNIVLATLAVAIGASMTSATAIPAAAGVARAPGCPVFPADNVWNADVSALPVNARSADWLSAMGGASAHLHPDYGPSGAAMPYGIPYVVVPGSQAKTAVQFQYAGESDAGPYPFDGSTPIEGGQGAGGDRHALMLDRDRCVLYELYDANWNGGRPTAGSGAVFDLRSDALRPATWTSADAAGLPIFPGLVRLDEVNAGAIDHAIRVTAQRTDRSFVWPARHQAGAAADPTLPPMGARFRMKAGVDISRFRPATRVILTAFKRFGMIVADNGSNWYFQGAAEDGWDNNVLDELKSIPAGDFEAVDESGLMVDPNSGRVRGAPPPPPAPRRTNPPAPPPPSPKPSAAVVADLPSPLAATVADLPSPPIVGLSSPGSVARQAPAAATRPPASGPPWWLAALAVLALAAGAGLVVIRRRRGAR